MSLQSKLLRFLQERVIERIGGRKEIPVDVRVICATHQDLAQLISEGRFREDLYYRINEATISAPPLRERQGDAVVLARAFLNRFAAQLKRPVKTFSPQALAIIEQHKWPGNVRELENRVKRAVVMADGREITPEDLELEELEVEVVPSACARCENWLNGKRSNAPFTIANTTCPAPRSCSVSRGRPSTIS